MTQKEAEEKLLQLIRQHLKVKRPDLAHEHRFKEELGADSLDLINLVLIIEEEFGITIPEEDTQSLTTVGEALALVEKFRK